MLGFIFLCFLFCFELVVEHGTDEGRELGIPVVTLAVEPMNSAKTLYEELGFRYDRPILIFNEEYQLFVTDAYEK